MKHENFAPPEYKEGLEADAVCGQCNSVNPEGTLICRTCGNNLRDQRQLRMAADQILDADTESNNRSVFLIRALSTLGVLLLLLLGLNAQNITRTFTSAGNSDGNAEATVENSGVFWTGPNKTDYDNMYSVLSENLPSDTDAENTRMTVVPADRLAAGDYILYERLGTGMRYAGAATIQIDGDTWRYNAVLLNGIEIRGEALLEEQMLTSLWHQSGVRYQDKYYAVTGDAEMQPDGSVLLDGESTYNTQIFSAVAYPYKGL
ncbi:MAG: hypothetical protein KAH38_00875 [Candidatus Hydrogenedentes bacterium]|nr:hypothetical protein [Candidatus Hydrogenedentota bacterium]